MSRLYSAESLCQAWEMESLDISIDFFLFIFFLCDTDHDVL